MLVIGIDPGLSGQLAVLSGSGELERVSGWALTRSRQAAA